VKIYERRSGRLKTYRTFKAETMPCPTSTYSTSYLHGSYDETQIDAWVRTVVKQ
jgi:hypothetical protein